MTPQKRSSWLTLVAWGVNITALIGLLVVVTLYISGQPAHAAVAPTDTPYYGVIATVQPAPYYLPTVTPNPRATPLEVMAATPTSFLLDSGRKSTIIGLSGQGRAIEVYTFGEGPTQRMIVAGIHGGYEWNTIALADELITTLDQYPQLVPEGVTLYILRNLNPDGDARSHDQNGRVNSRGVDLNRNFPVNWVAEWNRDGCWNETDTTGGTGPASEPETKVLMHFIETHKIDALISYHSAALGIFPGGEPWDADSKRLAQTIANVSTYPYPPLDTGCIYTGTLADYAVSTGAAAVDMELSDHVHTDYEMNLRVLDAFLNWER